MDEFWWAKSRETGKKSIVKRIVQERSGKERILWDGFGSDFHDWLVESEFNELFELIALVPEP